MGERRAIIVGISGCSSSGKTTLARLLRDIFPNTFILHEDDFYRPENELPIKDGLVDWDCAESLNIPDMEKALAHIRSQGTFPPFVDSKEDQNSVGECPVPESTIASLKAKVHAWTQPGQPGHAALRLSSSSSASSPPPPPPLRICLLDGFLLYTPPLAGVMASLDVRLFLLVSRARATQRREARDGYVTLEGFWKDPPGYVDRVVWPNYAAAHAWLFEGGDVEGGGGKLRGEVLEAEGIRAQVGGGTDVDMETTLAWAVGEVMGFLEGEYGGPSSS